jgi:DNA replication protein DnaC
MLDQQTINKLYELKLTGMAEAFADQLKEPDLDKLSFAERFGLIVDRQWTWKENNRMERYLKNAHMKLNACVEDIDYKTPRGIDRSVMMSLISCDWIKRQHNVIITGPTGAGKTFLACALTNKACREGYRALYLRSPKFSYQMAMAKGDGSYGKTINNLQKVSSCGVGHGGEPEIINHQNMGLGKLVDGFAVASVAFGHGHLV